MAEGTGTREKLLIIPLVLSRGVTNLPSLVVSILLIEIGISFNVAPGIAGQLNTASSLLSIIFALLIGLLSVKYSHKVLLILGLLLYAFSAASCLLAGTLYIMLPLFALTGVARAMVEPMVNSLIGTHIPAVRRTSVIGYTIAGLALIYVLGSLSVAYLSSLIDWRITLLLIVTPISVLTLVLTLYLVPSIKGEVKDTSIRGLFSGYKEGLRNRSVLACLIGTAIGLSTWNVSLIYGATFVRHVFGASTAFVSQVTIFYSLSYIIGSLLASRLAKKLGRKMLSVGTITLLAFFTLFAMNVTSILLAVGITILASFVAGMMITTITSLTLDQSPLYRGTVMSLQAAAVSMGGMVSAVVGGIVITSIGYGAYGIIMGVIGFVGSIVFHFFSLDPLIKNPNK